MNKKYFIFLIMMFFLLVDNVYALTPNEIKIRETTCKDNTKVELAIANEDGTLTTKSCYETYILAKEAMTKDEDEKLVIIEDGMIVDAKYALIDYDQATIDRKFIEVFEDKDLKNKITYIKATATSSDDAALLNLDYDTKRVQIKVNGVIGWIQKYEYEKTKLNVLYDIVPISWVKSSSHYKITELEIIHLLPRNVYGNKSTEKLIIGPKPENIEVGDYYSYDGHYFYKDLKTMLEDYKNSSNVNSINKDNPYYNYYLYLSFRSKTNYSAENINQYLEKRTSSTSKLYKTGEYFIKYQDLYGINALLMLAIGINESGWGNSNIALTKNNLFGLNAIDESPGQSANYFKSVDDCIHDYAYYWLSYGYVKPGDYRFKGANLGNKGRGLNVHYASSVYWGEIAASIYYDIDKCFGLQDYNSYQLAGLKEDYLDKVYAYKTPGGEKVSPENYQYKIKSSPIIILEEVKGPEVEKSTKWYKIMSDATLDENLNYVGSRDSNPRVVYNYDKNIVYVPSTYFEKINTKIEAELPPIEKPEENPGNESETPPNKDENNNEENNDNEDKNEEVNKPEEEIPEKIDVPIETIIETSKLTYDIEEKILIGEINTTIESIKTALTNNEAVITIKENDKEVSTGKVKTGQIVTIVSGKLTESFTIIVYGDINGDGIISAVDYVKVKNHIMKTEELSGIYLKAADVNKDKSISAVDYVNVKNYIMGNENVIGKKGE